MIWNAKIADHGRGITFDYDKQTLHVIIRRKYGVSTRNNRIVKKYIKKLINESLLSYIKDQNARR
jgi:hypothetical protein